MFSWTAAALSVCHFALNAQKLFFFCLGTNAASTNLIHSGALKVPLNHIATGDFEIQNTGEKKQNKTTYYDAGSVPADCLELVL